MNNDKLFYSVSAFVIGALLSSWITMLILIEQGLVK